MRADQQGLTAGDLIAQLDDLRDKLDIALDQGDGLSASDLLGQVIMTSKLISWMTAGWVIGPTVPTTN